MFSSNVNHIAIIVSDLERSRNFYVDKLGLKIVHRLDRPERKSSILYLDAGNLIIELFSFPSPPKRLSYPEACGLRHIAFDVENFDDIVLRLSRAGIETENVRTDQRSGKKMTFFSDPDGLPIEICEI